MRSIERNGTALSSNYEALRDSIGAIGAIGKRGFDAEVVLCGGGVMAKNFVGGVMIIYIYARNVADPLPPRLAYKLLFLRSLWHSSCFLIYC